MFEITWSVSDSQWERAKARREEHSPGSSYDTSQSALYQLLCGNFDIRGDAGELYGEGGVDVSMLDFAVFAARTLEQGCAGETSFDQLDDDRHVRFDFSSPYVRVSADDSEKVFEAPREEVIAGLRRFLLSLAHGMDVRAPRLFDWRAVEPLLPYRSA